jgi:hypothetical protein
MNSIKQKLVLGLLGLLIVTKINSQSLHLNGRIQDTSKSKITAHYVLMCDGKEVISRNGSKLKLKLEPNKVYKLTFSKPGYVSKSISLSTFSQKQSGKFTFNFNVTLKEVPSENLYAQKDVKNVADVFYDSNVKGFNYKMH